MKRVYCDFCGDEVNYQFRHSVKTITFMMEHKPDELCDGCFTQLKKKQEIILQTRRQS